MDMEIERFTLADGRRVRVLYDEHFDWGNYIATGDDEEDARIVSGAQDRVNRGQLVIVGMVTEKLVPACPVCGMEERWEHTDSLWGIDVEPGHDNYVAFYRDCIEDVAEIA